MLRLLLLTLPIHENDQTQTNPTHLPLARLRGSHSPLELEPWSQGPPRSRQFRTPMKRAKSNFAIRGTRLVTVHAFQVSEMAPKAPAKETEVCEDCGTKVASLILCPDGAEVCTACFNGGAH